jgi:large subunit ribosomal protein L10
VTREEKSIIIDGLSSAFKDSEAIVFCDYKGVSCQNLEELRVEASKKDVGVQVVKNTLAELSLQKCDIKDVSLVGNNIVLWGADQVAVAKTVANFAKTHESFVVNSAAVEGVLSDANKIDVLSKLHGKDELLGMLASVWMGPLRNFVTGLDNLRAKKEDEQ